MGKILEKIDHDVYLGQKGWEFLLGRIVRALFLAFCNGMLIWLISLLILIMPCFIFGLCLDILDPRGNLMGIAQLSAKRLV